MRRALPPLVLLLLVLVIAVRVAAAPARDAARERIAALLGDTARPGPALVEIEAYLESYDEPEDRWFAAEGLLRIGSFRQALAVVFGDPALAEAPHALRRFAEVGLAAAGWSDPGREVATAQEPEVLVALAEAGDPWAIDRMTRRVRAEVLTHTSMYLFQAVRFADPAVARLLSDAYRHNAHVGTAVDDPYRIAAAFTVLGPDPHPRRADDIACLLAVLDGWRLSNPDVWGQAALALGRSEDEAALAAIQKHLAFLDKSDNPSGLRNATTLRSALLASGDWSQLEGIRAWLTEHPDDAYVAEWLGVTAAHRYERGDAEARDVLAAAWRGPGAVSSTVRYRMGLKLLLPARGREPLDPLPVEGMLEDLDRERADPLLPTIAAAYRLRIGVGGAAAAFVRIMEFYAMRLEDDPGRRQELLSAWVFGLRCMLLYG